MERKTQFHVWALPLGRLQLLMAHLVSCLPASVRLTERGPTMKVPLALSMIQEQEGRTGANRAEDWSARPPQEPETHQCCGRCCDAGGERKPMGQMGPTERLDDEESESFEAQEESVPAAGDRED